MILASLLVLFIGQSNMDGYGNTGPAPYTPNERVQIWVGRRFETMRPGVNTGGGSGQPAWGPEVEFATRWLADHPEGVLRLGKISAGQTGLAQDPADPDWSPDSAREMFHFARITVRHMQAETGAQRLDVLMMQGETDAADATKASAYEQNLRDFVARARSEFLPGAEPTRFVLGQVRDAAPYAALVRSAQAAVDRDDADVLSVDTRDFTTHDGVHFDAPAQRRLGAAFYAAWSATPPAGSRDGRDP